MTRMPRVCMSIVASAFQYGWAPTLMPVDDDVDLAAGLGELDRCPRSTAAIQSMFSVPLSIAILAPGRQREPLDRHAAAAGRGRARR